MNFAPLTEAEKASATYTPHIDEQDFLPTIPVPQDAPPPPSTHPLEGKVCARWTYTTRDGGVVFYICRFNFPDGKTYRPLVYAGGKWQWKSIPFNRPLYGLEQLAKNPDAKIILLEGEKAAVAAQEIFPSAIAITSSGGSNAADKSDWSALKGRHVIIWRDNDDAGQRYQDSVLFILQKLDCFVEIVNVVELASLTPDGGRREPPKGWDCADAIEEWSDKAALLNAVIHLTAAPEPPSKFISFDEFSMSSDGLFVEITKKKGEKVSTNRVKISSAFEINGASRGPDGRGWGKQIKWLDRDGRIHNRHVGDEFLYGDAAILCKMLASEGLFIDPQMAKYLVDYLVRSEPKERVTVVHRSGWHEINGRLVFITPIFSAGVSDKEQVVLDLAASSLYEQAGTLAQWRGGLGTITSGQMLCVLLLSASFSGPLLRLAKCEGGGIHIFGQSSKGKTTVLQAAASVWGRGATPGYVRSWRSTANGLEGVAAGTSDTLLVLDEVGMIEGREVASAIYGLSNGAGKQRATRTGELRQTKDWRIISISSGELPVENKLSTERGQRVYAGQLVRMLDIPADRGLGAGCFDNSGVEQDTRALADRIKQEAVINFGTAGPAFVTALVENAVDGEVIRQGIEGFVSKYTSPNSDGQVKRAAQRFALFAVAGELATEFEITAWQAGEATAAAAWALNRWMQDRGGDEPVEEKQAIQQVRKFFEAHGESRFEDPEDRDAEYPSRPVSNRAGWRKGQDDDRIWLVPSESWKDICNGLDPSFVAKVLYKHGMLLKGGDGHQQVHKIDNRSKRVYVITTKIFDGDDDEDNSDEF